MTTCIDCGIETPPGSGSIRCVQCWNDRNGSETTELEQVKFERDMLKYKLNMIYYAVEMQAKDCSLWCECQYISEAILQDSLRDLHKVIEESDSNAMNNIVDRAVTSS